MAEERLDVVIDPAPAKRGIDVLIQAYQNMAGAAAKAETATTQLFDKLNAGFAKLESAVLSFKSVLVAFGSVIGAFTGLSDQFSKFQSFISTMSVAVGTTEKARDQFSFLMGMADRLGVSITSLTHNYGQLAAAATASGMSMGSLQTIFESFATASRVLHLSNQDTRLMFYAITQMVSKGVVSMEELRRQLGEKLPGAMNIAAESVGLAGTEGMKKFEDAVRKGTVDSAKFLIIFAEEVKARFSAGLPNAMKALDAEMNRLGNNWQKMIITMFDFGVADSFTNVIKELNRIMGDKKIAEEFAKAIKMIADGTTEFLKTISAESVRKFVTEFSSGIAMIGTTITERLLPFLKEMATLMKEIVAAWVIIKAAQAGAAIGGLGGSRGAVIGGLAGAAVGAGAVYYGSQKMDKLTGKDQIAVSGKILGQKPWDGGEMDMGGLSGEPPRKKHTLDEVLTTGGKNKEYEAQLKHYEAAILSLQKVEAGASEWNKANLDILAGKYDKLSEAQRQNLLGKSAIADFDKEHRSETEKYEAALLKLNKAEVDGGEYQKATLDILAGKYRTLDAAQRQNLITKAIAADQDKAMDEYNKQREKDKELMGTQITIDADAERARATQRYEMLKEQYTSEEDLLVKKFEDELAIANEMYRLKLINETKLGEAIYNIQEAHEARMRDLSKKKMTDRQKFESMSYKEQASMIFGELASITAGVAQHNKTLFQINKVAGIANAIINTATGVSKTLGTYPWPLAGIMAAIHLAAGLAQVEAISSAQFGSGSAPSISGSTAAPPVTDVPTGSNLDSKPGPTTLIELHGEVFDQKTIRTLIEKINENTRNGGRIMVL